MCKWAENERLQHVFLLGGVIIRVKWERSEGKEGKDGFYEGKKEKAPCQCRRLVLL